MNVEQTANGHGTPLVLPTMAEYSSETIFMSLQRELFVLGFSARYSYGYHTIHVYNKRCKFFFELSGFFVCMTKAPMN